MCDLGGVVDKGRHGRDTLMPGCGHAAIDGLTSFHNRLSMRASVIGTA